MTQDPWAHIPPPPPPPQGARPTGPAAPAAAGPATDRFIAVPIDDADPFTEDDAIEALPPRLRRLYLQQTSLLGDDDVGLPSWKDKPRAVRWAWGLALLPAFLIACVGFVIGLGLILTLLGAPFGFLLWLGTIAPLGCLVIYRMQHQG